MESGTDVQAAWPRPNDCLAPLPNERTGTPHNLTVPNLPNDELDECRDTRWQVLPCSVVNTDVATFSAKFRQNPLQLARGNQRSRMMYAQQGDPAPGHREFRQRFGIGHDEP